MKEEGQLFYYQQGKNYWWIRGKYNLILDLIKRFCGQNIRPENQKSRILDIGSGPGNLIEFLQKYGQTWGNDVSPEAVKFCQKKGFKIIRGNIDQQNLRAKNNSFNLILMIDVLEHLKNDLEALKRTHQLLVPDGQLVITVPAYQFLWGRHDTKYGHQRRYTLPELKKKLIRAGFTINKISYFEPLFLLPLIIFRSGKKISQSKSDDFVKTPALVNTILLKSIEAEKYYLRYFNFTFGATILAIGQKTKK